MERRRLGACRFSSSVRSDKFGVARDHGIHFGMARAGFGTCGGERPAEHAQGLGRPPGRRLQHLQGRRPLEGTRTHHENHIVTIKRQLQFQGVAPVGVQTGIKEDGLMPCPIQQIGMKADDIPGWDGWLARSSRRFMGSCNGRLDQYHVHEISVQRALPG
jgi:hypothetical protein